MLTVFDLIQFETNGFVLLKNLLTINDIVINSFENAMKNATFDWFVDDSQCNLCQTYRSNLKEVCFELLQQIDLKNRSESMFEAFEMCKLQTKQALPQYQIMNWHLYDENFEINYNFEKMKLIASLIFGSKDVLLLQTSSFRKQTNYISMSTPLLVVVLLIILECK